MHVSVIIVNYHTHTLVRAAVDSVLAHTSGIDCEIIVVDNAGGDEGLRALRADDRIRLVALDRNDGFGAGNNAGAAVARGEMLMLLNPDTLLRNNAIEILYRYLEEHPDCGIAGGNLFDADGNPAHSYHRMPPSIASEMDFATQQIWRHLRYGRSAQFNHTGRPLDVAMITGADLMIRSELFERLGGFDTRFFMYNEDADLCRRVLDEGYRVVSVPRAEITHLEGRSFAQSDDRVRRILTGRKCYFDKHYSPRYCRWADRLNRLTLLLASPLSATYRQRYRIYNEINRS